LEQAQASAETFVDGWLHTGDSRGSTTTVL